MKKHMPSIVAGANVIAYTLLYIVAFMPLLYTNGLVNPTVTTKAFFFSIVVLCAAGFFLFSYVWNKQPLLCGVLTVVFGFFMMWALVATLVSENTALSFWSTIDRMEGYFFWAHLFVFFVLMSSLFDTKSWYRWIRISFFVSLVVAFMSFAQHAGNYELANNESRIDILFGNPIFLALYTLIHIGFGLLLLFRAKKPMFRVCCLLGIFFLILTLFYTETRGALLALICGTVVGFLIYAFSKKENPVVRNTAIGVAVGGICVLGTLIFFNNSMLVTSVPYLERFSAISVTDIKNQSRYYIWEAALDGIDASPFFGYGFDQFGKVFEQYVDPSYYGSGLSSQPEFWMDRAHNMLLDTAINVGVPALVLLVASAGYAAFVFLRSQAIEERERAVLLGILVAYSVHSLFSFNMITGLVFIVVLLAYAQINDRNCRTISTASLRVWQSPIAGACVFLLLIPMLYLDVSRIVFASKVDTIIDNTEERSIERIVAFDALGSDHIDSRYTLAKVPFLAQAVLLDGGLDEKEHARLYNIVLKTEQLLREQNALTPKELYYFGNYYRLSGHIDDAERVVRMALQKAPNRQILHVLLGKTQLKAGAYSQARETLHYAYELEPAARDSILPYAAALLYTGDVERADSLLKSEYGSVYIASDILIRALLDTGDVERAEYILSESVEQKPERILHWRMLLELYESGAEREKYEQTLKAAKKQHPEQFDFSS